MSELYLRRPKGGGFWLSGHPEWGGFWARCLLTDAADRFPGLATWWDEWCANGGLKRAVRAEAARTGQETSPTVAADLVRRLAALLDVLPAQGELLAVLARRLAGDAHALDASRPLGRLAAAVVARGFAADPDVPGRKAWAAAGVVVSSVASTVLCLGVPGVGQATSGSPSAGAATAMALEAMRSARMPVVLTLDQVRSRGIAPLPCGVALHVCENPTVVEVVAERWAATDNDSAPVLVCTGGQPSTAVMELLEILTASGAACRYHGDFDWPGLRIAAVLRGRIPWEPWRYTENDYVALADSEAPSRALTGRPAESGWDPRLAAVMAEHGKAIEEEVAVDILADDVLVGPWDPTAG